MTKGLHGCSLTLGLVFCFLTFNAVQAQISLSSYICEGVVMNTLPSDCVVCRKPIVQTVLGDDNTITPYL